MAKLKLSPPWDIYATEVETLFKFCDGVHVVYDHEEMKLSLYVDDGERADALSRLMPHEKVLGNTTLHISVIPGNTAACSTGASKGTLYRIALQGNKAFSRVKVVKGAFLSNDITFVVFAKEVVQFYTDNLGDLYGLRSTLWQEIAKDVFGETEGVFFCTEPGDSSSSMLNNSIASPLGEWP